MAQDHNTLTNISLSYYKTFLQVLYVTLFMMRRCRPGSWGILRRSSQTSKREDNRVDEGQKVQVNRNP